MRLIDADELLTDPYFQDESIPEREMFIEAVEDSPTIDAVHVVRCRDCVYRGNDIKCPLCRIEYTWDEDDGTDCYFVDNTVDDGYCQYGSKINTEVE